VTGGMGFSKYKKKLHPCPLNAYPHPY
jgi:hypothetical protein